jgi:hypothetical protein
MARICPTGPSGAAGGMEGHPGGCTPSKGRSAIDLRRLFRYIVWVAYLWCPGGARSSCAAFIGDEATTP